MHYNYVINQNALYAINTFYNNVATKYCHDYSFELMTKNISDAFNAMYKIENGLPRRKSALSRWKKWYMASYTVNRKTRWNYAYRIEGDTVYIEDACHAQNMSEFANIYKFNEQQTVVIGDLNYNFKLISNQKQNLYGIMTPYDEILIRHYYDRIIPFHHCSENYNRMHAIGIKNGRCFAIDFDGNTEVLSMNASELSTIGCRHFHNLGESKKKQIRLTEAQFKIMLTECITKIINEIA